MPDPATYRGLSEVCSPCPDSLASPPPHPCLHVLTHVLPFVPPVVTRNERASKALGEKRALSPVLHHPVRVSGRICRKPSGPQGGGQSQTARCPKTTESRGRNRFPFLTAKEPWLRFVEVWVVRERMKTAKHLLPALLLHSLGAL